MYHPIEIEPLSKPQVGKLLRGQPVRAKKGKGHKIHVSAEQHKKLHKAHMKGSGITLTFDPYQCEMHHHMHGEGILSKLKSAASKGLAKAKQFYSANESRLAPLKEKAKALATSKLMEYGSRLAPSVEKHLGELGSQAFHSGLEYGAEQIAGQGLKKHKPKRKPLKGKGIKQDIQKGLAKARAVGRKAISFGQRYVAPALGGIAGSEFGPAGAALGSQLARKLSGGALIAAGYGGGMDSEDEWC